ncbi:ribonuclease H-like domain-containing protein [Tanacetum coccineum]
MHYRICRISVKVILGSLLGIFMHPILTLLQGGLALSAAVPNWTPCIQFTRDNNYTIEFDAFGFSVKDYLTRHILLRCDSSSDLYPVTKPSTSPIAFLSTSASTWHQRLGHPGDQRSLYGIEQTLGASCLVPAGSQVAYLLIYVDDIILTASSLVLLQQIVDSLHKEFDMTDLGALNYFLAFCCSSLQGGLQYLTFTRPDLSYAVQQVCLYMHDPREPHFAALKRIMRYVQGTLELGLQLYASTTTSLVGYTDADWAGCPSTRRSTSGYYVFLGDNLLSWSAKRQHTISRSSAEAEYRGVANVVAKTAWIRNLLHELHSPLLTATLVYLI